MNCAWSTLVTAASILAVLTILHLFFFPFGPSMDYFGVPVNISTSVGLPNNVTQITIPVIDLDNQYLPNAVAYRGAHWKPEIGHWLSLCDSSLMEVDIVEKIGGKSCTNNCSYQGVCNYELGQCQCFHGYAGEACAIKMNLNCNYPALPEFPYGRWVVSICPAHCDTTRAMCFCGEGTKYPKRPVAEACGFKINLPYEPGAPKLTDWTKADLDNIFTTNHSKQGWCNVDPPQAYASKVKFKEECDCKYDGLWGLFCEVPVESVCLNQCSGHGFCRGGFCQCDSDWYGSDCSTPSISSSVLEWPQWLRPAQVTMPSDTQVSGSVPGFRAVVKRRRPLIYVYDLPPEFNSLLLEGRHFKFECVNRIYDDKNATVWTDQLYGAQIAIYESLLASSHRTLNGEEADYFFVPVLDSCIITRADDAPHLSMQDHKGLRSSLTLEYYRRAFDHISSQYTYWNHSSGRDHIWVLTRTLVNWFVDCSVILCIYYNAIYM
uniref:EGF-like domain-containing protein n=1 Tax=Kalanchoe fedtschenkoi TaxID=63787 RepID=A0A7N1A7Y6_KALFE